MKCGYARLSTDDRNPDGCEPRTDAVKSASWVSRRARNYPLRRQSCLVISTRVARRHPITQLKEGIQHSARTGKYRRIRLNTMSRDFMKGRMGVDWFPVTDYGGVLDYY